MDLFLLRHGLSTSNEKRLVCGAADYPLSDLGKTQAARVCAHLNGIAFTKIYVSPLTRARETLAPLCCDVPHTVASELIELDTGEASHLTVDDLWARDPRYRYQGLHPDLRYPGGESLHEMLQRVGRWYERASATWSQEDVVLVSGHEGTVCGILHKMLALEVSHYPTFLIGNCDYVHVQVNADMQIRYRFVPLQSLP